MNAAKKKRGGCLFPVLFVFLLAVAVLFFGVAYCQNALEPVDPGNKDLITVEIPKGSTAESIGKLLDDAGVIKSSTVFNYYSRFKKYSSQYIAGFYGFTRGMSLEEICRIITSGKTNTVSFTIPEGYTEYDIADILAQNGIVDRDKFVYALESHDFTDKFPFLKKAQEGKHRLEGYLFPRTYTIQNGAKPDDIIEAMLARYDKVYKKRYTDKAGKMGYSEKDIIIIASIVEKEVSTDEERAKVASVIYNRLNIGMKLQMDATVNYVLTLLGRERKDDLHNKDTAINSAYNTYKHKGLPPGPICCPGEASIKAALSPADTDYLYFVLSDKLDGSMSFSRSSKVFEKNKADYYKAKKKAGR